MSAASKLLLLLIVGGAAYGYYQYTLITAAEEQLRDAKIRLFALNDQVAMKKSIWVQVGEVGRQNLATAEKKQTLLKARNELEEQLNKIRADVAQATHSIQSAVEKVRASAVGTELGDLTLTNGKVLHGTKIRKVDDSGISYIFAEGVGTASVALLPENLKEKYDLGEKSILPKLADARTALQVPARQSDTVGDMPSATLAPTPPSNP